MGHRTFRILVAPRQGVHSQAPGQDASCSHPTFLFLRDGRKLDHWGPSAPTGQDQDRRGERKQSGRNTVLTLLAQSSEVMSQQPHRMLVEATLTPKFKALDSLFKQKDFR